MANDGIITLRDLNSKFRASGTYFVYRDQTATPKTQGSPILRLIYGSSKKGIFNVPVFIEQNDISTFRQIYGDRDKSLERKRSFFHKSCEVALESAPILALALLKTNDETINGVPTANADVVPYMSYSLSTDEDNGVPTDKLFSSYFSKDKFWKPSTRHLLATRDLVDDGKLLNIVNLSQEPITFIVKKSDVPGYDVTLKEWYDVDGKELPAFLKKLKYDLVSDYIIDIIAVRGDFTDYERLSKDVVMGDFFDKNGLKADKLDDFLARKEVSVINVFTGSIIPSFRDKDGTNMYIESVVNNQTRLTGIMVAIDTKEFDKFESGTNTHDLDLVGHHLINTTKDVTNFLSYKKKIKEDLTYTEKTTNDTIKIDSTIGVTVNPVPSSQKITLTIDNTNPAFNDLSNDLKIGNLFKGVTTSAGTSAGITITNPVLEVSKLMVTTSQIVMDLTSPLKDGETASSGSFVDLDLQPAISETLATADVTLTGGGDYQQSATMDVTVDNAGNGGDQIDVIVDENGNQITLGSYTTQSGDTATVIASAIETDINNNTATHGYTAISSGSTITITAPLNYGDQANGYTISINLSSGATVVLTANNPFQGGVTASTFDIRVNDTNNIVNIGSYTFQNGDTLTSVAASLAADINSNTATHGYTATQSGATVTITAPTGTGASANNYLLDIVSVGTSPLTYTTTPFQGGITAIGQHYVYEKEQDRIFFDSTQTYLFSERDSKLFDDYKQGILVDSDVVSDGTNTHYIKLEEVRYPVDYRKILRVSFYTDQDLTSPITTSSAITFGNTVDSKGYQVSDPTKWNVVSAEGVLNQRFVANVVSTNTVRVSIAYEQDIKVGQYLVGVDEDGNDILAKIISIKRYGSPATEIEITTTTNIKTFVNTSGQFEVERYLSIPEYFDHYNVFHLKGFEIKDSHLPDGTNQRMKDIVSIMTDTSMFDALIDPEMIDFRFLVDTYNNGLEPQSKRKLSRLCKIRQVCLGILNTPAIDEFEQSQNPRFTTTPTPSNPLPELEVKYIAQGGNLDENPDFLYTLPEEEDGASFVGFFMPNISVREDNGDFYDIVPAPYVSNNFMLKYRGSNPFLPVGGPKRGIIKGDGVAGVTKNFSQTERGLLEQKGINPIYQKKNGDIIIMGNETAYKRYRSILNNLNARETLIILTIDTKAILDNYLFELNTDTMRIEIVSLLDNYYSSVQNGFGAIESYEIIYDRSNNPEWVVTNNASVVDVIVILPYVNKKFINRITLKDNGSVIVGGFLAI